MRMKRRVKNFERRQVIMRKRLSQASLTEAAQGLSNGFTDMDVNESEDEEETPQQASPLPSSDQENLSEKQSQRQVTECCNLQCKEHIASLQAECQALRTENFELKGKLKKVFYNEISNFEGDDDKVKVFTGIPTYAILMSTFNVISAFLSKSSISPFQQYIMTLLSLRMNLSHTFLSYLYGVHQTTVTRRLKHCINVMYVRLVPPLVVWPQREQLTLTLPYAFRNNRFNKCACIIYCFEIFIEKAKNLLAYALSYSSYKSHNTLKYLIGITPQGTISFISNGWDGGNSDMYITENCGLLKKIQPNDLILADRGFDCSDSVNSYQATLQISAFTKGKTQLNPLDLENTRGLAAMRLHVERVISVVRQKYTILQSTVPNSMIDVDTPNDVMLLDKIVKVCCALTNLS